MIDALIIYNTKCLKCSNLYHEMIKVGLMVFCPKCFDEEFISTGIYNTETGKIAKDSENYKAWFETYMKYVENIIKVNDET